MNQPWPGHLHVHIDRVVLDAAVPGSDLRGEHLQALLAAELRTLLGVSPPSIEAVPATRGRSGWVLDVARNVAAHLPTHPPEVAS